MKKVTLAVGVLFIAGVVNSYDKVCRKESPFARSETPFRNKIITYHWSQAQKMQTVRVVDPTICYVHLNRAERKIVLEHLKKYEESMAINEVLQQIMAREVDVAAGARRQTTENSRVRDTMQKVLKDFSEMGATNIGHVLDHLSGKKIFVPMFEFHKPVAGRPVPMTYQLAPQVKPSVDDESTVYKPTRQIKPAFVK